MESALLVLALAYARYCEPLQPHVREVVETAMSKLTPDQRWNIERSAGESFLFSQRGTSNNSPSVREGVERLHATECEWGKAQLRASVGEGIYSKERLKSLYTKEELERQRQGK